MSNQVEQSQVSSSAGPYVPASGSAGPYVPTSGSVDHEVAPEGTGTPSGTPVRISDDDLNAVRELNGSYQQLNNVMGQIAFEKRALRDRLTELDEQEDKVVEDVQALREREQEVFEVLNTNYGQGNLDLDTGIFTPST